MRNSDSGVVIRMSVGVRAKRRRSAAGVSPERTATLMSGGWQPEPGRRRGRCRPAGSAGCARRRRPGPSAARRRGRGTAAAAPPAGASVASRSSAQRNADSVLPEPVGATTRAWSPELIASQAPAWAVVGAANEPRNHSRGGGGEPVEHVGCHGRPSLSPPTDRRPRRRAMGRPAPGRRSAAGGERRTACGKLARRAAQPLLAPDGRRVRPGLRPVPRAGPRVGALGDRHRRRPSTPACRRARSGSRCAATWTSRRSAGSARSPRRASAGTAVSPTHVTDRGRPVSAVADSVLGVDRHGRRGADAGSRADQAVRCASRPSTASTSRSGRARRSGSSGPTAPASPRRCGWSAASRRSPAASCGSSASTPRTRRAGRSAPGSASSRSRTPSTRSSPSRRTSGSTAATSACPAREVRAPGRRAARVRPAHRAGRRQGRAAVRRHEAPADHRALADQPARDPAARRADHRPRPAGPARALGPAVPAQAVRASPWSSPPTTWTRPSSCATGSSSWTTAGSSPRGRRASSSTTYSTREVLELRFDVDDHDGPRRRSSPASASGSRCCPTGSWSTPTTATQAARAGARPRPRAAVVAGAPVHARGRVPAPHRPDAGGLTWPSATSRRRRRRPAAGPRPRAGAPSGFGVSTTTRGLPPHLARQHHLAGSLSPLLFLLSMGVGPGLPGRPARRRAVDGASPTCTSSCPAILAAQTMWVAMGESTYQVLGAIKWNMTYHAHARHAAARARRPARATLLRGAP